MSKLSTSSLITWPSRFTFQCKKIFFLSIWLLKIFWRSVHHFRVRRVLSLEHVFWAAAVWSACLCALCCYLISWLNLSPEVNQIHILTGLLQPLGFKPVHCILKTEKLGVAVVVSLVRWPCDSQVCFEHIKMGPGIVFVVIGIQGNSLLGVSTSVQWR